MITVNTPAFAESVTEGDVRWEKGKKLFPPYWLCIAAAFFPCFHWGFPCFHGAVLGTVRSWLAEVLLLNVFQPGENEAAV